ncbi:alpha/beta hydrolase [Mucilaginibacter sp. 14171R-50]|uniref:alpha/beta fold hydrolase n=1 Tax=Mucilaginibacter sp. 14171R-50 TaxID=2703789 RepID=UPI00138BE0C4|nr:alpha/beta hydrolase [Mucilaginibacter sp. 14171R-50]QHS57644.1 alpha/beta hydrolase [Mucilaginibacter sp. 14171R-50]
MKFLKNLFLIIILLIIFGGAALYIIYDHYNAEKKELTYELRKSTNGSYIDLTHGVTHYELDGPDTGKVVVMLHGVTVPYYIWNGTFEYLTEHGFRVLRYDQYGRGYSDRPDVVYNKQLYFEQLNELIDQLHLKKPVSLVGVSFGGMLATDFTVAYPDAVNKVVLIDPGYPANKIKVPQFVAEYYEAIHPEERALGQMDDFKYPDRHPTWVERYRPQMEYKGFRHAIISTVYNYGAQYNGRQSNAALNNLHKPVMLIWGKEDKTVPFTYSDSVRSVLKTEFLPVDDAGHLPYIEQADIVNPALVTFLRK